MDRPKARRNKEALRVDPEVARGMRIGAGGDPNSSFQFQRPSSDTQEPYETEYTPEQGRLYDEARQRLTRPVDTMNPMLEMERQKQAQPQQQDDNLGEQLMDDGDEKQRQLRALEALARRQGK